jgi:hypothetical protein
MPRSVREYFQHILDETTYLLSSSHGLDKATFMQDETLKRAYVGALKSSAKPLNNCPRPSSKNTLRSIGVRLRDTNTTASASSNAPCSTAGPDLTRYFWLLAAAKGEGACQ